MDSRLTFGVIAVACAFLLGLSACGGGGGNSGMPQLSVSPATLQFQAAPAAQTNPAPGTINVTNSGTGNLTFSAASDSAWLSVTPTGGNAPQSLQVSAMVGALAPGVYTGHITITSMGVAGSPATVTVSFSVSPTVSQAPFWGQWGANAQHSGMVAAAGQSLTSKIQDIVYDPFVAQEQAENAPIFGEAVLTVHYQAPITDGNDVYMMMKMGSYDSCATAGDWANGTNCGPNNWASQEWCEVRFSKINGQLAPIWSFDSDWAPEPNATNFNLGYGGLSGWEPVFHPAEANNYIYIPGGGGTVWKVDKTYGTAVSHINPFQGNANVSVANTYVAGPLTADASGNIYYNAIQLADPSVGNPWDQNDVVGAWLVKITPSDQASMVSFATLVPNAPAGTATTCPGMFGDPSTLPWPPATVVGTNQTAPPQLCGSQRPGLNIAPAVAPDGTIYTASRAHFDELQSYLVAVNPDLTPKWAASLQTLLSDGCGVIVPIAPANNPNQANSCRNGATPGVDPTTNAMGSGFVPDQGSSSPTVLPDGSVIFGALTNYNASRGHLFKFSSTGQFLGAYDFGWDDTPGVWQHNGTYSIVMKDNHYDTGLYCGFNSPICASLPPGPYYITQLDANLNVEWQFQSTTIDANHPNGYEWCVNMPAVDMNGNVYVNSEDGNAYELPQGNSGTFTNPTGKIFLKLALGAAYTPLSLAPDGTIYTQNDGNLFVVGN